MVFKERVCIKDAQQIIGDCELYHADGRTVCKLGKNSAAFFNVDVIKDDYYTFRISYGNLIKNAPSHLQCLLDNRVIGTTYFSKDHQSSTSTSTFERKVNVETLGTQLVLKGKNRIEIRAMFENTECFDYIEISPTEREVKEPLFSFVVISDTHIHSLNPHPFSPSNELYAGRIPLYGRDGIWEYPINWINRMLYYRMPEIMKSVISDINRLSPDLVIHTGDLSGEKIEHLIAAKSLLDRLNCPYYIVRGNHDQKEELISTFSALFEKNRCFYKFVHKGFCFVILDGSYFLRSNDQALEHEHLKELEWLEAILNRQEELKTFIFIHEPLVTSDSCLRPYDPRLSNCEEILNILSKYAGVKAVFAGHSHINQLAKRGEVYHFQTPGLVEYPMLYRQVVVFPSSIEVRSYQVSNRNYLQESFLTTSDNILGDSDNGWVIGDNSSLYCEMRND